MRKNLKKISVIFLSLVLALMLVACGDDKDNGNDFIPSKKASEIENNLGDNFEAIVKITGIDASDLENGNVDCTAIIRKDNDTLYYSSYDNDDVTTLVTYLIKDDKFYVYSNEEDKYLTVPGITKSIGMTYLVGYEPLFYGSKLEVQKYDKVSDVKIKGVSCKKYEFNLNKEDSFASFTTIIDEEMGLCYKLDTKETIKGVTSSFTFEIISFKKGDVNLSSEVAKISSSQGQDIGGDIGGNTDDKDEDWYSASQLNAYSLNGLPSPKEGTYTYSYYNYSANKSLYIGFKRNSEDEFIEYAKALYNYGFNLSFNEINGKYTSITLEEALTGVDYVTFNAYKHIDNVYRLRAFGQKYANATSITIVYEDLSFRPEYSWFTASEANALGLVGLDSFANISNKKVEVSIVRVPIANSLKYSITVSGVLENDAIALIQYLFNNGANIAYYDYDNPNAEPKTSYDDSILFTRYDGYIDFSARFCSDCDVSVTWYDNQDLDDGLPQNILFIELEVKNNHSVGNH